MGLDSPFSGSIDWPSSKINSKGLPESDIGFVFQDPTLMPWTTVFDNVHLLLKLRGVSKTSASDIIMDNLASVGLADFARSYPRELSGDMRMRVSIARSMVTRLKLLLMDEPFAALDEITRQKLNDNVVRLWKQHGVTVIFVTHSVYESAYLSTRIVVMRAWPRQVFADMAIAQPTVRDQAYRASKGYRKNCQDISCALQDAIGAAEIH